MNGMQQLQPSATRVVRMRSYERESEGFEYNGNHVYAFDQSAPERTLLTEEPSAILA